MSRLGALPLCAGAGTQAWPDLSTRRLAALPADTRGRLVEVVDALSALTDADLGQLLDRGLVATRYDVHGALRGSGRLWEYGLAVHGLAHGQAHLRWRVPDDVSELQEAL